MRPPYSQDLPSIVLVVVDLDVRFSFVQQKFLS